MKTSVWSTYLLTLFLLSRSALAFSQSNDPTYDKTVSKIEAKLNDKKFYPAYKSCNKALESYPNDNRLSALLARIIFYGYKHPKIELDYPSKNDAAFKSLDLMASHNPEDYYHKGFYMNMQRHCMITAVQHIKKGKVNEAFGVLNKWFAVFNNQDENLQNIYTEDIQDTLFFRGRMAYIDQDFELADKYFNWMDSVFNGDHFENKYDATKVMPYEGYYFEVYQHPKYYIAHTAMDEKILTEAEKQVIFMHNLVRIDPLMFDSTYVKTFMATNADIALTEHGTSLRETLRKKKPAVLLFHDQDLTNAAAWHANDLNAHNATGHESSDGSKMLDRFVKFNTSGGGENCSFGRHDAVDIILGLLVDLNSEKKGHRRNILYPSFDRIGLSIKPHPTYGSCIVIDYG
ncbi:CAP domain-containing protein [Paracrocinitomix mangrovi]|uniref:CAP domain-containing protein n=1 Tax=Paracrocinitomix mangrovi TaxID=2862509 RepID=UPI001C8EB76B|nr:CAP domain-containing protein [Paracrocinitomix mangrovi]UKN00725.1 CAP domain-containing protein [Paracrocinitomix mangrovi]